MKGIVFYELIYPSQNVNADCYKQQLVRVHNEVERKRPFTGHGTRQITLQQENARLDVAKEAKNIIVLWTGKSSGLRYWAVTRELSSIQIFPDYLADTHFQFL